MKAAFFDVDGTLTTAHVWKGLMAYFRTHGLRQATHLVFTAVHYPLFGLRRLHLISESTFRTPWAAHLAWYLRGYTPEDALPIWDWIVGEFLSRYWRPDSRALLDRHLKAGDVVVLVSSGPAPLMQRIAQELGTEHAVGTRFGLRDGHYSGGVLPPVCIDAFKASLAQDYLSEKGIAVEFGTSFTYADSTSDLSLLEMVGHPVATYPDEGLRAVAQSRGWTVFPGTGGE